VAKSKKNFDLRNYSVKDCPVDGLVNLLAGPWTTSMLLLIRENGEMRFGQLKRELPSISSKMLTERLRLLENAGILRRRQVNTIPPKVFYDFTKHGKDLEGVFDKISEVALAWDSG
jgi:DNA-binding HxlR family transcriptional regulator